MLQSKELKNETQTILDTITIEEWILILLYAQKDKPITGKLMFVKQAFLLAKDVFPSIEEKFEFYPASFGPYSKEFAKSVNKLIEKEDISLEILEAKKEGDTEIYRFRLSKDGEENAKNAFNKLPDEYKNKIRRKRRGWDQLGYTGIVRLVYTKYPEYAIYSNIKESI